MISDQEEQQDAVETEEVETEEATEAETETSQEEAEVETKETPATDEKDATIAKLTRQLKQTQKKLEKPADITPDERYDRLELKTEGITSKAEQDEVLSFAKFKNIPVLEAMKAPAVRGILKEMRDKAATPAPSTRIAKGVDSDVSYWVRETKKGNLAPNAEMRRKVEEALKGQTY